MSMLQFYTERSADCRRDADSTALENVRQRYLSAALAWDIMANRVRQTEASRADGVARRRLSRVLSMSSRSDRR